MMKRVICWFALLAVTTAGILCAHGDQVRAEAPTIAVIVHAKNASRDVTSEELRAILTLDRQFWPDGQRIMLVLRAKGSVEQTILLDKVYKMSDAQLKKQWMNRLFAGEIPAMPTFLRPTEAAVAAVKQAEGGITVVLGSEIPEGINALTIDGKHPGDAGYILTGLESPSGGS